MKSSRASYMEIDISAFKYNIKQIQSILNNNVEVMPIIKANAYGTYINERIDLLNDFNIVGVAIVNEGKRLRELGFKKDIFILNPTTKEEIQDIIDNDIIISVSSIDYIRELAKTNKNIRVHLEVETGLARTGFQIEYLNTYIKEIEQYKNIIVEGIYSHFSSAESDFDYTKKQINLFNVAMEISKKYFPSIKAHCAASAGLLNFKEAHFDLVRSGLIIYGYYPSENLKSKIKVKPIAKLKSIVLFLNTLECNSSVGYNRNFITKRVTKVAIIPIGYADGIKRILSNKGHVYINGIKSPIIGNICMDNLMVDVTNIPNINIGDEVIIFDNENITVEEIAKECKTINYEILSTISPRIPRIFIN